MNIRYGLAAAALGAGLCGGSAFAGGFLNAESAYVGAGAGVNILQDEKLNIPGVPAVFSSGFVTAPVLISPAIPGASKLSADLGWLAAGTIGLRWSSGLRAEMEGAYRDNDFKVNGVGGSVTGTSVMFNGLYDFNRGGKVQPYLGIGAGALFTDYDHAGVFPGNSQTTGAFQVIGGLTVPFSPRWEGFADYRYFSSLEKMDHTDDYYVAHELMLGIRYTFWEAPKPVAAAPPPPPPASKDYVIYFEFNKSNITPAAGAVLDEVKTTVGGKPVSVVGHTDTVGSMKYNQGLSEKRAHSTGKALVKRGVKVEAESGRSFSEPAVNTGPGVKEPLNRRAVIKVDSGAGM